MTDLEFLIMLKRAFKDHLNAPNDKQPSLLSMLDLMKFVRQEIEEEYKLKIQIQDDETIYERKTATEIQ